MTQKTGIMVLKIQLWLTKIKNILKCIQLETILNCNNVSQFYCVFFIFYFAVRSLLNVIHILYETLLGGNRFLVSTFVFPFTQITLPEIEVSRDLHVRLSAMFPLPTMATLYTESVLMRELFCPGSSFLPGLIREHLAHKSDLHWRSWERYVCHWAQFCQRCHRTSSSNTKHCSAKNSITKVSLYRQKFGYFWT